VNEQRFFLEIAMTLQYIWLQSNEDMVWNWVCRRFPQEAFINYFSNHKKRNRNAQIKH